MPASSRERVDHGLPSAKERAKSPLSLEASPSPETAPLRAELSPTSD